MNGTMEELRNQRGATSLESILASVTSDGGEDTRVARLIAALGGE